MIPLVMSRLFTPAYLYMRGVFFAILRPMETVTVIVRIETESGACLKRLRASLDSAGQVCVPELNEAIREELARVAEYERGRAMVAA